MDKVKTGTAPAVFLPKFQKPAHSYPTNFSKLNYVKPTSQLSRLNYRISVRVQNICKRRISLEWVFHRERIGNRTRITF